MKSYDKNFYRNQKVDNIQSARIVVPMVLDFLKCVGGDEMLSVIDLGCGSGNWLSVFKDNGCRVKGVDFGDISEDALMIDRNEYVRHDFSKKYMDDQKYSLSMSLECVEHVPGKGAEAMVDSLMSLSDVVLFSGAIPHQRGRGHVNERWQSYWVDFFDKKGYQVFDVIRGKIWNNKDVRGFYAENMFLFVNRECKNYLKFKNCFNEKALFPYDVIHPEIWEQVNSYKLVRLMDVMHDNRVIAYLYYRFFKKNYYKRNKTTKE